MTTLRDIAYYAQLLVESVVGVVGIRLYEEPRYAVVAELPNGVEIRRYDPRLAAQVELAGGGSQARDDAFRLLFRYIAGANVGAEKIAMTVPVATGAGAEKIAMTVPVESMQREDGVRMQFFLPAQYSATTAPRPADERVRIVAVPGETVAVLRFSGSDSMEERTKRSVALLEGLSATPWRPAGDVSMLFYDAPFTIPFLRRNEAAVRVNPR
jgi:hypothetical protein